MKLINSFVSTNIDELYAMRPRQITYNPGLQFKNLDQIPSYKLSGRQVNFLEEDKEAYKNYLIEQCETKILARRAHWGKKQLAEVYRKCEKNIPYQKREKYVESHLESRLKYFDTMDDLNKADNEMENTKKEICKRHCAKVSASKKSEQKSQ